MHKILKNLFFIVLGVVALIWLALFGYQKYLQQQVKAESSIQIPPGINSLQKVILGDVEQWILFRGDDVDNPVLLFLHGGPGAPLFPYARDIGYKTGLEKQFVMVYWEQRGTGKSFHSSIPDTSMTVEQLVSDTHQLSQWLVEKFKVPKIFIMARSWGSLVGLKAIHKYPDPFHAYVGIGQMIHPLKNDSISYEYTLRLTKDSGNQKAIQQLQKIGPPPYHYQDLLIQRKWLTRFYEQKYGDRNIFTSFKRLLSTPEYSLLDILQMGFEPYYALKHLWDQDYYQINLHQSIKKVDIPVYFFAGKDDYFTPPSIAYRFYKDLKAPAGKEFIRFEKSGHHPEYEQPDKFYEVIVDSVLKVPR